MKNIPTIFFIILLSTNCAIKNPENISTSVTIIGRLDTSNLEFSEGIFYSAKINLTNNSNSVLNYWTMSCSWQSNWIPNNKSIQLFVSCPSNFPKIIQIEPFGTLSHHGIIELIDTTIISTKQDFKFGFVFVREKEVLDESNFIIILRNKIETKKDIFWSNSFVINKKNH